MPNRIVIGTQWGDEGKAKVVDFATEEADLIIRFQGGANAGHTVEVEDKQFIFHLIPSGIMHPGKICVVGNGVVFEPRQFLAELEELREKNIETQGRVIISDSANVVFPYHKTMDQLKEEAAGKDAIGTTGRGIGPAYMDKVARTGFRIGDLLDESSLREKIETAVREKNLVFNKLYNAESASASQIFQEYAEYGKRLEPFVKDTVTYINRAVKSGKSLLFEGAQGTFLDVDHGTAPYVTSSNTVAGAACVGAGVGPKVIDQVIGVVKAYTTRVGNGPFPTELNDNSGEKLQRLGSEFGATTGRKRRCGWLDIVLLRKSAMVNGLTHLAITKLDVLDNFEEIKVCTAYEYQGEKLKAFPSNSQILERIKPVYKVFPGWKEKTTEITEWGKLPENAKNYLGYISKELEVPLGMVSLGPKRHQTIKLDMKL